MNKENILIVDDSDEILFFLSNLLEEEGYETLEANSGETALNLLEENNPDLILLDIRMPGIDGFEVCKRVKSNEKHFEIPIIFLSGASEINDKLEGLKIGAVDYVTKPFRKEELMARLKTHLSLREKEKALVKANKELILAKENVEKNEALFNAFMEHSPVSAYIKDANFNEIYNNHRKYAKLNSITYDELVKSSLLDETQSKQLKEADEKILNEVSVYQELEYKIIPGNDNKNALWLKDIKFPIKMPDGKKLLGGMTIDITETKLAEEELLKYQNNLEGLIKERTNELIASNKKLTATNDELNKQKKVLENTLKKLSETNAQLIQSEKMASLGILVAGVAHEINNPINFINSSLSGLKNNLEYLSKIIYYYDKINSENCVQILQQIREKEKDASLLDVIEMFKKSIEIIEIGIGRTTAIVKGLKSFARADSNEIELFNVNENIENTLIILKSQYKNRIEIIKKFEKIPSISCYAGQINQVFMNILVNAFQSINDKGEVIISTYVKNKKNIYIKIEDNGAGIPNHLLKNIFDPFYTTKKVGHGTGLGLSISYNIIKAHEGDIFVESEVGKGTKFTIVLPIK